MAIEIQHAALAMTVGFVFGWITRDVFWPWRGAKKMSFNRGVTTCGVWIGLFGLGIRTDDVSCWLMLCGVGLVLSAFVRAVDFNGLMS